MAATGRAPGFTRDRIERLARGAGPFLAEFALPFVLVLYLSLESGGYDAVTGGEVGIVVWWLVLLGAMLGLLARGPIGPLRWVSFGLLAAFAGWTALGFLWTESSEQTMLEVSRVLTYLGVLALALSIRRPGSLERVAAGVGAAIAIVAVLAVLSRLHPAWFPENTAADFLPLTAERLSYPLGYWNGLAALLAMAVPLALVAAAYSRRLLLAGIGAAVVPVIALAAFYTLSRGGALEIAVGLVVLFALAPRRLALLPTIAVTTGGSAVLVLFATQRDALEDGLLTDTARSQGDEMILITILVCAAVGLIQVALRHLTRGVDWSPGRRFSRAIAAVAAVAVVAGMVVALAAGLPGEVGDAWEEFKTPAAEEKDASRFVSASGSGRYQNWGAALDANATEPLTGIGPGTYKFWWARTTDVPNLFVRDAHSLYLETLGEAGIVGLAILLAFLATVVWATVSAARRVGRHGAAIAGAGASCAAYLTAAAVDWVWELPAVAIAFLFLAGALVATRDRAGHAVSEEPRASTGLATRAVQAAAALIALIVIAIPTSASKSIAESERAVAADDLAEALERADTAVELQPYAATPSIQRAIVLELAGDLDAATSQAQEATRQESTNWQTWLLLSRLEARRGNADESLTAYRKARSLNPQSPLFQR